MNIASQLKAIFIKASNSDKFVLIFILITSILIRFPFLNAGLFHHDSAQLAVAVEKLVNNGELQGIGGGRHGLVIADSVFFYVFKTILRHESAEFSVNFASAFFGVIAVLFLYLLAKELLNDRFTAFSSAMLYSVTPIFLSVSTFANSHSLSVFLVLLSFHFLIQSIKSNEKLSAAYSGIFIGASFLVRESNLLLLPAAFYLIFSCSKNLNGNFLSNEKRKIMLYYAAPIVIGALTLLLLINPILEQQVKRNFGTFVFNQITYSISGLQFTLT